MLLGSSSDMVEWCALCASRCLCGVERVLRGRGRGGTGGGTGGGINGGEGDSYSQ